MVCARWREEIKLFENHINLSIFLKKWDFYQKRIHRTQLQYILTAVKVVHKHSTYPYPIHRSSRNTHMSVKRLLNSSKICTEQKVQCVEKTKRTF